MPSSHTGPSRPLFLRSVRPNLDKSPAITHVSQEESVLAMIDVTHRRVMHSYGDSVG